MFAYFEGSIAASGVSSFFSVVVVMLLEVIAEAEVELAASSSELGAPPWVPVLPSVLLDS